MKTITFIIIALTTLAAIVHCQRRGRFPPRRNKYVCSNNEEILRLRTKDKWIGVCCVFYYRELFLDGVNVEEPKRNEEQLEEVRRREPEQETRERNHQHAPMRREPEQELRRRVPEQETMGRNPQQAPGRKEPRQELQRYQEPFAEPRRKREEPADQPHRRPGRPECDVHPLELQGENIGKCCTFMGKRFYSFQGALVAILPQELLGAAESTEAPAATTTLAPEESTSQAETTPILPKLGSRFFIDSACKKGYVLDANYECVPEF